MRACSRIGCRALTVERATIFQGATPSYTYLCVNHRGLAEALGLMRPHAIGRPDQPLTTPSWIAATSPEDTTMPISFESIPVAALALLRERGATSLTESTAGDLFDAIARETGKSVHTAKTYFYEFKKHELRADATQSTTGSADYRLRAENEQLRAENERLRAENERLRAEPEGARGAPHSITEADLERRWDALTKARAHRISAAVLLEEALR